METICTGRLKLCSSDIGFFTHIPNKLDEKMNLKLHLMCKQFCTNISHSPRPESTEHWLHKYRELIHIDFQNSVF